MQPDADDAAVMSELRQVMSGVKPSDFERIDPPVGLWDKIAAGADLAAVRSRLEPPSQAFPPGPVAEYWIDVDDVVIAVGESWADVARDNDAEELAVPASDRTLWTYFDGEVVELWQLLVAHVRASRQGAQVPIRCDAPDARRWFNVDIAPEPHGRVHFRCVLVFEEARPPVSLLDFRTERDGDLEPVPLCSWCGRAQHDSNWLDIEELIQQARLLERTSMPPISHGVCASCREAMSEQLLVSGAAGRNGI